MIMNKGYAVKRTRQLKLAVYGLTKRNPIPLRNRIPKKYVALIYSSTTIAWTGQLWAAFLAQAVSSWLTTSDLPWSFIWKVPGHREMQAPQPMQASWLTLIAIMYGI
jgi:hypothetical protein